MNIKCLLISNTQVVLSVLTTIIKCLKYFLFMLHNIFYSRNNSYACDIWYHWNLIRITVIIIYISKFQKKKNFG